MYSHFGGRILSFIGRLELTTLEAAPINPKVESIEGCGLREVESVIWQNTEQKEKIIVASGQS